MVGIGFWQGDQFAVKHLVVDEPDDEEALLRAFSDRLAGYPLLVTFNGRRFDVPLLERRYAHHNLSSPFDDIAHLDLLPLARRVFPGLQRYALSHLEKFVLDFERVDDVPGRVVPTRWGKFQRSKNPDLMAGVVEHNRHDIVSMAALVAAAIAGDDPRARREEEHAKSPQHAWSLPKVQETSGGIVKKLVRSYRLRGKFADGDHSSEAPSAEVPTEAPTASGPSPTPTNEALSQRIDELRTASQTLVDQDLWREAFPMLCELVALAPGDPWGLETLASYYRREGREDLAARLEKRLSG